MTSSSSLPNSTGPFHKFSTIIYRYRWPLSITLVSISLIFMALGMARVAEFSNRVAQLADIPKPVSEPKVFDTRTDIWFDPLDEGLAAYRDVEARFIAEDTVIVAFEEEDDPWGAFGTKALTAVERLSSAFEKVPYVRNVRSLTTSPWIRNAEHDSEGELIVTDLFDQPVSTFSQQERLKRMISVLGAKRASALVGEHAVAQIIGPKDGWSNYLGEERFLDSIVSSDGRTAAVVVQIIRQKASPEKLQALFSEGFRNDREVGQALYTIDSQSSAVTKIMQELRRDYGYQLHITGVPVLERHFPEVGMGDMTFLGVMFLVIGGVLYLIYRRTSGVLLPLGVVLASIFAMNGIVWLNGDLINNLTASTPIIMTAVGIADAVHLVTAYFLIRSEFESKDELIITVVRRNALPVFLTSLTTVVAFLSLTVSAIVPVKQLGYTAAIGTAAAYLLSMTVVPAALSLLPLDSNKNDSQGSSSPIRYWTDHLAEFVVRRRVPLTMITLAVLGLSAFGLSRLEVESDLRLMFPASDPVVIDQTWIESHLGGSGDLDIVFQGPPRLNSDGQAELRTELEDLQKRALDSPLTPTQLARLKSVEETVRKYEAGAIATNAEFLSQVDRFERQLKTEAKRPGSPLKVITSIDSGLSVLRRMHQVQNDNLASFYRVPKLHDVPVEARTPRVVSDPFSGALSLIPAQSEATLSAQYYLQYENGARPAENLSPFVSPDRRAFRLAVRVASQSSAQMLAAYDQIREIARSEFPDLAGSVDAVQAGGALSTMRLSGKHYLFMNMMERFTDTLVNSLALALLLITAVIAVVFRSLRLALISMVPNVVPLLVPLAFLGILGVPLDGPAVIVATIALGICVDDTIHLLTKFTQARTIKSTTAAIQSSFRQVGGAITWTSLTLVLGFAVLSLSNFRPNMLIGLLGATMIALAWICDMVLTPALLSLAHPEAEIAADMPRQTQPEPAQ